MILNKQKSTKSGKTEISVSAAKSGFGPSKESVSESPSSEKVAKMRKKILTKTKTEKLTKADNKKRRSTVKLDSMGVKGILEKGRDSKKSNVF